MKLDNQITGNIGLYYACFKLSCLGWNVLPTSRNARGVDIIAYNHDGTHFFGIQVKALTKRDPVPIGTNLEKIMGDFWIVVNNIANEPSAFILLPTEIREGVYRGEKDSRVSYWLQARYYESDTFREAWYRIGRGNK